jgi:steroid 5-alpha reductase family enzyme
MKLPLKKSIFEGCKETIFGVEVMFVIFGLFSVLMPLLVMRGKNVDLWQLLMLIFLAICYAVKLSWFLGWRKWREREIKRWEDEQKGLRAAK